MGMVNKQQHGHVENSPFQLHSDWVSVFIFGEWVDDRDIFLYEVECVQPLQKHIFQQNN